MRITDLQQAATAERINVPSIPASLTLSHISVNGNSESSDLTSDALLRVCRRQIAEICQAK